MEAGPTQTMTRLFRAHPIRFPFTLTGLGAIALLLFIVDARAGGLVFFALAGLGAVAFLAGIAMLPFGLGIAARRARHPLVLRCPVCGAESRASRRPFQVEYFDHVDYARVVCSNCGADFTVDKFAKLE